MITHEFAKPIPPGTLRISVIADDQRYAADFPTNRLSAILEAFVEHAGIDAFDESGQQAKGGAWDFRLFAMPHWPTTLMPYKATPKDTRRRWR